jgi:hypothetical protein
MELDIKGNSLTTIPGYQQVNVSNLLFMIAVVLLYRLKLPFFISGVRMLPSKDKQL